MSAAGAVTPVARRLAGVAVLAASLGGAAFLGTTGRSAVGASYAVPFSRGETPGADAEAVEAQAASMLRAYPQLDARVTGYVEPGGDAGANAALSVRRAEIVRDALVADGIAASRLHAVGGGVAPQLGRGGDGRRDARADVVTERR